MASSRWGGYVDNGQFDTARLVAMGYEQQLSRGIRNWVMSASVAVLAVGTVPFVGLDIVLQWGGPATVLASWVITSVFTLITVCALAEICSSYPNSGATYHWTGQLAPQSWAPLASYVVGLLLVVGNVYATAAAAANAAEWIANMAAIQGTEISPGATLGIAVACVVVWVAMNLMPVATLARLVVVFAAFQAAVAVMIPVALYSMSSPVPQDGPGLWSDWVDESGFVGLDGYAAVLGATGAMVSLVGFDASAHVAEETLQAHWTAPIGMVAATAFSVLAGLWLVVAFLLFVPPSAISTSSTSSESSLNSGGYGLLTTIIVSSTSGSMAWTQSIAACIAISLFMSGYAAMAVTARVVFAMARDDALPLSSFLRYLHHKRESPDLATCLVAAIVIVIMLFSLGDVRAYNWVVYPFFSCLQLSYAIPLGLRVTVARKTFPRGVFHLGWFSEPAAIIAALWCLPTGVFLMLPTQAPVVAETMNWSSVSLACIAILATIWWFAWARVHYAGPRVRRGDLPPLGTRSHRNPRVVPLRPMPGLGRDIMASSARSATSPNTGRSTSGLLPSKTEALGDSARDFVQAPAAASAADVNAEPMPGELIDNIFAEVVDAGLADQSLPPRLATQATPR